MLHAVNKFSGLLLRLVLTMALVIPFSPVMASAELTKTDLPAMDHCIENTAHSLDVSANNISQDKTTETNADDCQKDCCPDGDCPCDVGCAQSRVSSSSLSFIYQNMISFLSNDSSSSFSSFNTHASSFNHIPSLRPPIF